MTLRHPLLGSACVLLLLLASACGESSEESPCGEPLYAGSATDEAWRTMVDAQKKPLDSSRAVTVLSPAEGQTFAADESAPRISWSSPLQSTMERYAAHLAPFTGDIYLVQVTLPGRLCPVEVLTSELSWQLDATGWTPLAGPGGQDYSLQVTSAYLQENRLKEGPYRMETPRTFHRVGLAP